MATQIETRTQTMRAWVKRREDARKPWTSDELWSRILTNWPTMKLADQEAIFRGAFVSRPIPVLVVQKEGA